MKARAAMRSGAASRWAWSPTAVALACLGIGAQEPAAPRARRDAAALAEALASHQPEAIAWAAHDARTLGDKSLGVPLQGALRRLDADDGAASRGARALVLDALLGLRAKVPPADLLPLLDHPLLGVPAFALLAQQPRQNEAELFALFRRDWPDFQAGDWPIGSESERSRELRTWAIGNLLAAQRTPGFAAFVFERLDLDLHVVVTSGARVHRRSGWRLGAPPPAAALPGLPPVPTYELARMGRPHGGKAEELAAGEIAVGLLRTLPKPEENGLVTIPLDRLEGPSFDGQQWLRRSAGSPSQPWRTMTIDYEGDAAYVAAVLKAHEELRAFRKTLLQGLVTGNAMSADDAARFAATTVEVRVDDQRGDGKPPLPAIPNGK